MKNGIEMNIINNGTYNPYVNRREEAHSVSASLRVSMYSSSLLCFALGKWIERVKWNKNVDTTATHTHKRDETSHTCTRASKICAFQNNGSYHTYTYEIKQYESTDTYTIYNIGCARNHFDSLMLCTLRSTDHLNVDNAHKKRNYYQLISGWDWSSQSLWLQISIN